MCWPSIETFPMCQDRLCNLGAEPSRNTQNDPILTEGEDAPDVPLGYTLDGQKAAGIWQRGQQEAEYHATS